MTTLQQGRTAVQANQKLVNSTSDPVAHNVSVALEAIIDALTWVESEISKQSGAAISSTIDPLKHLKQKAAGRNGTTHLAKT